MTKKFGLKICVVLILLYVFLFSTNNIIRNYSYYDIKEYSFMWSWLFSMNSTLREFPKVYPVGQVIYNFRGFESNTLDMEEYQIEYVAKVNNDQVIDICIKYFEGKGYIIEKTDRVGCTWEIPSNVNYTTQYYKCSLKKNDCLTFVITKVDNNLTSVKLFLMH